MKGRLFLCLICLLFILSVPVLAEESEEAELLDFTVATGDLSGEGWTWTHATRTLRLESADLLAVSGDAIHLPANARLRYSGDCKIRSTAGSAIVAGGRVTVSGSGNLDISGSVYGVNGPETVLFSEGITVFGQTAAASGTIEGDGGVQMLVFQGQVFQDIAYTGQQRVRTGKLYPVYVSVSHGGGASFYVGMFSAGQTVVLSARPQGGYGLQSWSSDQVALTDPEADVIAFLMPETAVQIYGQFERTFTVTVPETEGGHVEFVTGKQAYVPGQQVVLYAVPDTGYYFSHWTSDYGRFRDPLQAYAALTMPSVNVTATPVFVKGESYYLKVEKLGEGEVNLEMGNFPQNKSVLLRATPAEGYVFSGWMSEAGRFLSSVEAETYFTMPGQNVTVTAVFSLSEEHKKTLTVQETVGGKVNVTGGLYAPGMPITLLAEAKTGYKFVGWSIEPAEFASSFLDTDSAETQFLMPAEDTTVSAKFELLDADAVTFYLSVGTTDGGTVVGDTSGDYLAGYEIDLAATPAEGYYFVGWKSAVGGRFENELDPNTIFYMPANDTRVTASFALIETPVQSEDSSVPPVDGADLAGGIHKKYFSFGLSLGLCALLAAGGTVYAEMSRKAAGIRAPKLFSRRKKRTLKDMRPRRRP